MPAAGDPVEKLIGELATGEVVCGAVVTEEVVSGNVVAVDAAPSGATT